MARRVGKRPRLSVEYISSAVPMSIRLDLHCVASDRAFHQCKIAHCDGCPSHGTKKSASARSTRVRTFSQGPRFKWSLPTVDGSHHTAWASRPCSVFLTEPSQRWLWDAPLALPAHPVVEH